MVLKHRRGVWIGGVQITLCCSGEQQTSNPTEKLGRWRLRTGGTELGVVIRPGKYYSLVLFNLILCLGAPDSPVFQPNSCEPPGPLPGSQLPLLGEFFEIPGLAIWVCK